MASDKRFSFTARARSFGPAGRGLYLLVVSEHNAWIHAAATLTVAAAGLGLGVTRLEWALLALAIAAVWAAEGFNAAVERLSDAVTTEHHPLIGAAKDLAAGAVLATALGATVVGALVFVPPGLAALGVPVQ